MARRKVNRNPGILNSEKMRGVGNRLSPRYLRGGKKISEAWKIRHKGTEVFELKGEVWQMQWGRELLKWRERLCSGSREDQGVRLFARVYIIPPGLSSVQVSLVFLWTLSKRLHVFQPPKHCEMNLTSSNLRSLQASTSSRPSLAFWGHPKFGVGPGIFWTSSPFTFTTCT